MWYVIFMLLSNKPQPAKIESKKLIFFFSYIAIQVFKPDEENDFYDYMKNNTFHYYGLTITEFRKHAYDFARKINARYPPTWDENELAGIDWYYCFMKRNPHMAELMEGEAARKAAAKANGEQSTTPEAKGSKRRTETTEEKDYHC